MSSLPSINGHEAVDAFSKIGFVVVRVEGSHHVMKKPGHKYLLSVPIHGSKSVKRGTLRGLIRASGISVEEFVALLD